MIVHAFANSIFHSPDCHATKLYTTDSLCRAGATPISFNNSELPNAAVTSFSHIAWPMSSTIPDSILKVGSNTFTVIKLYSKTRISPSCPS